MRKTKEKSTNVRHIECFNLIYKFPKDENILLNSIRILGIKDGKATDDDHIKYHIENNSDGTILVVVGDTYKEHFIIYSCIEECIKLEINKEDYSSFNNTNGNFEFVLKESVGNEDVF